MIMAPQYAPNLLRVVTQRLSSTPSKQLPQISPYLVNIIAHHGKALATSSKEGQAVGEAESTVVVHKLKTQLSVLLQDKNPEARYTAVILIRATIEVGGWNILQEIGAWVRGLIGILGKSDPSSTKKLCIITLTRIFLLTHEHQALTREISTPSLPGFIAACLNLTMNSPSSKAALELSTRSPLLLVVLHSLSELIAMHPTIFRPFIPRIHSLTYPLIAPTSSTPGHGNNPNSAFAPVSESARRLFVLLHVTGPKSTAAEEWRRSLDALIILVQRTADKVFRSLIEDRVSSTGSYNAANPIPVEDVVSDLAPTPLALPAWTGIYAGIERLEGLLDTLQAFLATATAAPVTLPVGDILNLVDRIFSIIPPGNGRNPRLNSEIGRDEREGLWVGLPRLQISVIAVCSLMITRMGHSSAAMTCTILEQLLWAFESQYENDDFREAAYTLVSQILSTFGSTLPKSSAISLSRCIRMCCEDLLPSAESQLQDGQDSSLVTTKPTNRVTSTNADSYLKAATNHVDLPEIPPKVLQAARGLLPLALTNLSKEFLPFSLRCQIDRTAIITNNRRVMLASVMNPISKHKGQKQTSSILPLLARAHPEALQVEALIRPQMPPIQSRRSNGRDVESDEEADTYMHDHPEVREFDGFYRDLAGSNGNANGERNIVLGHSGVHIEATSGAVEEGPPRIDPTDIPESSATGLQEPESAVSYTSKKRDREEESESDAKGLVAYDSTEQFEIGVASKRYRVGLDQTQEEAPLELATSDHAIVDTGGTGQTVKSISASDSAAVLDRHSSLQQGDSDESEFEMPILNLDPDSDEEEEEEEEGDE